MAERPLARGAAARLTAIALLCFIAGGCAAISLDVGLSVGETAPEHAPPPDGKRLADLATSAFGMAKLAGAPEISPVHATHDSQWGDWMFCIGSSSADQPMKYAVLIGHDAILNVRSSVLIDGCDQETYQPLTAATPPVKAGGRGVVKRKQP